MAPGQRQRRQWQQQVRRRQQRQWMGWSLLRPLHLPRVQQQKQQQYCQQATPTHSMEQLRKTPARLPHPAVMSRCLSPPLPTAACCSPRRSHLRVRRRRVWQQRPNERAARLQQLLPCKRRKRGRHQALRRLWPSDQGVAVVRGRWRRQWRAWGGSLTRSSRGSRRSSHCTALLGLTVDELAMRTSGRRPFCRGCGGGRAAPAALAGADQQAGRRPRCLLYL